MISSTALLQYSFYYKWCHFRQDRHKQTVSSELPIVIKLAIFQTIHSLSHSVTFQSPALSKRGVYYLSCTTVHFQEKARIIVWILYNYTWAPHFFGGDEGGTHKRVGLAFGTEMCLALHTAGQTQKTLKAHSAINMWQTECLEREWIRPYLSGYSHQAVLMLSRGVIGHNAYAEQAVGADGTKRIAYFRCYLNR